MELSFLSVEPNRCTDPCCHLVMESSGQLFCLFQSIMFFYMISKIFGDVSELQEKAKKEGILKNDNESEATRTRSDENFMVWNSHLCLE